MVRTDQGIGALYVVGDEAFQCTLLVPEDHPFLVLFGESMKYGSLHARQLVSSIVPSFWLVMHFEERVADLFFETEEDRAAAVLALS